MTRKNAEAEELATDEHGKTRKKTEAETRKRKQKKRHFCHGMTRKNTEGKPRMDPRIREDDKSAELV